MKNKFSLISYSILAVLFGLGVSSVIVYGSRFIVSGTSVTSAATLLYDATASGHSSGGVLRAYYLKSDAAPLPDINARAFVVADLLTGDILLQKGLDKPYQIASVTKLATAQVALNMSLQDSDLLYPLLLESNNQTAESIAATFGRQTFLQNMNDFVSKLGMTHTHFADPSGISPRNVASVRDLLTLTQYIYKNAPDLLDLTLVPSKDKWQNNNLFVQEHQANYLGGKSGYTPEAKGTLVSVFALPLPAPRSLDGVGAGDELRPVVVILLGTDSKMGVKYEVSQSIIDYVLANVYFK